MKNKVIKRLFVFGLVPILTFANLQIKVNAQPEDNANTVFINEIVNNGTDWVEIINAGSDDVDISGWFIVDDKGLERYDSGETTPFSEGTILKAGEVIVVENGGGFDFGIGKKDTITLYNAEKTVMDSYTCSGAADGSYARVPDGTGEFVQQAATKGTLNGSGDNNNEESEKETDGQDENTESGKEESSKEESGSDETEQIITLAINEINSAPDDWVEFKNTGTEEIDLSGIEIRDNSDDHRFVIAEGTKIGAGELFVVDAKSNGKIYDDQTDSYIDGQFEEAIGIGSGDSIRVYSKNGTLIDEYSWTQHASFDGDDSKASYGRYPDGTGNFILMPETKNAQNQRFKSNIVVNEVESNDDETDWVEIYNAGTTNVDISGWYILDNEPDKHKSDVTPVAEGTVLAPGAFFVFDEGKQFGFGLGKNDCATVYDKNGEVVASFEWSALCH